MKIALNLKNYLLAACFSVLLFTSMAAFASADTIPAEITLKGFAWSSNIGWISLNCENDNNCAQSSYKVTIGVNGDLSGFAWSSNIGWIKFNNIGLPTDFPPAAGTKKRSAYATGPLSALKIEGWARACAGTFNAATGKNDCTSATVNPLGGGWDGWISLSGPTHSVVFNATMGTTSAASWAWGSNVVGWIDMHSYVNFVPVATSTLNTFSGTNCDIPAGASSCNAKMSWSIDPQYTLPRIFNVTDNETFKSVAAFTDATTTLAYNTSKTFHARNGTTEFDPVLSVTVSADCGVNLDWDGTKCVSTSTSTSTSIPPNVTIKIIPSVVRMGGNATVTVTMTPESFTGTCKVIGGGLNETLDTVATPQVFHTNPLRSRSLIQVTCSDDPANVPPYTPFTQKATVDVIPVAQEI